MRKKQLYKIALHVISAAALMAVVACSSEEPTLSDPSEKGGTFTVIAEVAQQLYSRGSMNVEDGYVKEGLCYLSYPPRDKDDYGLAEVNFHKEPASPGIGIVTILEDGDDKDKELKWDKVKGSSPTFYLDNVSPELAASGSTPTYISFSPDNNPYKAGLYKDVRKEGTNDLLWGDQTVNQNTKNIHFDLHHQMAGVRVQVTVDRTNDLDDGDLDLEDAEVAITSINHTPIAYNRLDGSLLLTELDESKEGEDGYDYDGIYEEHYQPLVLVGKEGEDGEVLKWFGSYPDEKNDKIETYVTQDFVLPPQDLLAGKYRPKLEITLKNGTKYSGILPHAMFIEKPDNSSSDGALTYPVALSFLKEHILTIRTVITQDPPELAFMPVMVVEWVDKGEFTLEAHQSGIYNANEFYQLIKYYNGEDKEKGDGKSNNYQLSRYGCLLVTEADGSEKWHFDFFSSVTLDFNEIKGRMTPDSNKEKKEFSFDFNNFTIYIRSGEDQSPSVTLDPTTGPKILHDIVTGKKNTLP